MVILGHLGLQSGVPDLKLGQQELTNLVKLPQFTTGEQGEEGIGCHEQLPQLIGQLGHKIRPREGLWTLMPASQPTLMQ